MGRKDRDTPLLLLKRKVKKMIEDEDSSKPLTDDAIASLLQIAGNRGESPDRGEIPRRHGNPQHPPASRSHLNQ